MKPAPLLLSGRERCIIILAEIKGLAFLFFTVNLYNLHSLTVVFLHLLKCLNGLLFNALKTYYCYLCGTIGMSLQLLTFLPQGAFTFNKTQYARRYLEQGCLMEDGEDSQQTEEVFLQTIFIVYIYHDLADSGFDVLHFVIVLFTSSWKAKLKDKDML